MDLILRVSLPTKLRRLFDYLPLSNQELQIGTRVLVPFKKQIKIGVVVETVNKTDCPIHKLKPIIEVLDSQSLFSGPLTELIFWASRYYQCALGEVFESSLPKRLKTIPKIPKRGKKNAIPEINAVSEINNIPEVNQDIHNDINTDINTIPIPDKNIPTLNAEQHQAVQTILKQLGKFQTFLLEGVTGSGKTEVYMQVIEKVLAQNKQALVLVPEIGLTPQLLTRFKNRFKSTVSIAVLHSSLTEKQRFMAWEQAKEGSASIIIGTRSSVFVPLHAPGVFIIDEEHDTSFKQHEGSFRYHARDLCIMRASLENCPIILGSATPSLETLHNVHNRRFQSLLLTSRAGTAKLPNLQIIDIRHKKLDEGLSSATIAKMKEQITAGGQVLVFLNRRGFAPVLMCVDCGWIANCHSCDSKLTFHYQKQKLLCHHCESSLPLYECCPNCSNKELKLIGLGTERLEAALTRLFPSCSIARLDRDTTRKKNALQEALSAIEKNECQIIIGTQMIAKGHHFPNITLVVILEIDQALFSNDFRSQERMGQLITQVAGRAGRDGDIQKSGTVLLQTAHPNHPLLTVLLDQGYRAFSDHLLMERRTTDLPPFSYQILFRAEAKKRESTTQFLLFIKNLLQKKIHGAKILTEKVQKDKMDKVENKTTGEHKAPIEQKTLILGPVPAPMERRIGKFRSQLLLQAQNRGQLQKLVHTVVAEIENHPLANRIRWSLDVDPVDLY